MKETTSHLVIETLETHVELCKQAKKKKKARWPGIAIQRTACKQQTVIPYII